MQVEEHCIDPSIEVLETFFDVAGKENIQISVGHSATEFEDIANLKDLELGYIDSVKNIVKNIDAPINHIVKMASENPAKYIGLDHKKGSIESGKDGDLLIIDDEWNILNVYVEGIKQNINN